MNDDVRIDKLIESGLFTDSTAAYALAMFHNLKQSNSGPLINAKTGKEYTIDNFGEYLKDQCKIKPQHVDEAIKLVRKLSD